jgi:hypothetical protein
MFKMVALWEDILALRLGWTLPEEEKKQQISEDSDYFEKT